MPIERASRHTCSSSISISSKQQAALHAMVHAKKICQHAGSCITCTVCTYREAGFIIIIINQHFTCTRRRRRRPACVRWTGGKKSTCNQCNCPPTYLLPYSDFPSCSKTTTDEQMMAWLACIHAVTPRRSDYPDASPTYPIQSAPSMP